MKKLLMFLIGLLTACSPTVEPVSDLDAIPFKSGALFSSSVPVPVTDAIMAQEEGETQSLLDEIKILAEQRQTNLVSQPGWLHLQIRKEGTEAVPLFDRGIRPDQYEQEEWIYLNEVGSVITGVKRMMDGGQQLQVQVLGNGRWTDLTLHTMSPVESGRYDSNFGFYDLANRLVERGRMLHTDTIYYGCWYQGERFTISDGQNYYEAVFNPHRGSLRWIKRYHIIDGAIVLVESMEMMVEERVDEPPSEILALLTQVPAP